MARSRQETLEALLDLLKHCISKRMRRARLTHETFAEQVRDPKVDSEVVYRVMEGSLEGLHQSQVVRIIKVAGPTQHEELTMRKYLAVVMPRRVVLVRQQRRESHAVSAPARR